MSDFIDSALMISSPHSRLAAPIDRLSSLFALKLILSLGPKFNLRGKARVRRRNHQSAIDQVRHGIPLAMGESARAALSSPSATL